MFGSIPDSHHVLGTHISLSFPTVSRDTSYEVHLEEVLNENFSGLNLVLRCLSSLRR
jgi:hypothetical protein